MINGGCRFTVYGQPKGKGRPRFRRLGKYTMTYTPKETVDYENKVKESFLRDVGNHFNQLNGPIIADINCYCPIPKSISKKKKLEMENSPCLVKPDLDNIEKSILDPLNKIAYGDDDQVFKIDGSKFYSSNPRVDVTIKEYEKKIIKPIRFEGDNI